MSKKDNKKNKKESNIFPIVLGVGVVIAVAVGILVLATWSERVKQEQDMIVATEQTPGDGELSDYEDANYVTLADYSDREYTVDPDDIDDDLSEEEQQIELAGQVWDDYLAECEVKSFPDDLVAESKKDVEKQYESFAYITGVSYEELLESYGMDDDAVQSVAEDTVKARMVAKTIAYREGMSLSDSDVERYLLVLTSYEEGDEKESLEELKKDYLENYSGRYLDDCYVEMVKDWLFDRTEIKR